jgi:hypothetical protein
LGLQKLGLILEIKVVQKLNLEKNVFNKKGSPKLIFLDEILFCFLGPIKQETP